jgi:hypothetical protein
MPASARTSATAETPIIPFSIEFIAIPSVSTATLRVSLNLPVNLVVVSKQKFENTDL